MDTSNIFVTNLSADAQKVQTHACVSEVYKAMYEAVNAFWNYYHAEDTGAFFKYKTEELAKMNIVTFEEAEELCHKVYDLLRKYLLDIPTSLIEKTRHWFGTNVSSLLEDTAVLFPLEWNDPDDELWKETYHHLQEKEARYQVGAYFCELKDLFSEYIMP
ncbi:MAG: hypothetical protein K5891_06845 [Lachnospiraceae bacterium]|nr:hypothetical protein [Lachnospiraceae bacterium]